MRRVEPVAVPLGGGGLGGSAWPHGAGPAESGRRQPVILGVVAQRLWDKRDADGPAEAQAKLPTGDPLSVQLDKRRLDLEASDEIRLTCGKSSLVMRRDGTVIVRGVKIVSRATESNKIRGGTVSIN